MTIVSESDDIGEKIALTDAVDERRLGGSGSCLHAAKSCLGDFFGLISELKAVNSDSVSSGHSELLASSGIDWIVGRALTSSKGPSPRAEEMSSPFPSNRKLEVGSLIHDGWWLRDSLIELSHASFSRWHEAANSKRCSFEEMRIEQGNMARTI